MEQLPLNEEVVLLSLGCPSRAVARAVAIASIAYPSEPMTVKGARAALAARGFVRSGGLFSRPAATDTAQVRARMAGVWATINSVTPPAGRAAELLVLLALTGALRSSRRQVRLHARLRITDIGIRSETPPAVQAMLREFRLDTTRQLADALLLRPEYSKEGAYDPGMAQGLGGFHGSGS